MTGALNEGRDRSPGDSFAPPLIYVGSHDRSMRAGTGVPATARTLTRDSHQPHIRSMRAGTGVPATVVEVEHDGVGGLVRSMRAGTGVPATAARRGRLLLPPVSLNEGRDRSPGDSRHLIEAELPVGGRSMRAGTGVPATAESSDSE